MSYTLSDSDDLDDDNVETLISSNRARRDIALRAAKPRDKTLSDAVKDMIRDAAKADAQVDVFNRRSRASCSSTTGCSNRSAAFTTTT